MGAKKLAYQISTALVVLLFTFAGVMKVTPLVSSEIHNEMVGKCLRGGSYCEDRPSHVASLVFTLSVEWMVLDLNSIAD